MARSVIPFACDALAAEQPDVRVVAAQVIALLAPDADHVLPALAHAVGDANVAVRVAALEALGEFGPLATRFVTLVAERFEHATTDEERTAVASVLDAARGV